MTRFTVSEKRLIQLIQIGLRCPNVAAALMPVADNDWAETIRLAEKHDVAAWLFVVLKEICQTQLPPQVFESLRFCYLKRSVNFELRRGVLNRVLTALAEVGIVPILLKGAILSYRIYPDPICRAAADLDLCLTPDEMPRAQVALEQLGYTSREKSNRPMEFQKRNGGEVQLVSEIKTEGMIELHPSAFPGEWMLRTTQVDEEGVRARAQLIRLEDQAALCLSPEDTLIQLAAHFAISHQLTAHGLRSLLDFALLFQTQVIDWDAVIERARHWRLANTLYVVLKLTHDLMGQPRAEILKQLAPSLPRRIALAKFANLSNVVRMRQLSSGPLRFVFLVLLVDRFSDAARLLGRALWPEPEWLLARYGRSGWSVQFRHLADAAQGRV